MPTLLFFFSWDTLLLLSSCRRKGVHPELPGVLSRRFISQSKSLWRPASESFSYMFLRFRCIRHFVINVINNFRTRFIISFYVICAMICCSFYCILLGLCPFINRVLHFIEQVMVTEVGLIRIASEACFASFDQSIAGVWRKILSSVS